MRKFYISNFKFHKTVMMLALSLLSLVFNLSSVHAQITGVVVDARTRKPMDYVNVYYNGKGVGAMTDEKGRFTIPEKPDWAEFTVSTMGYITQVVKKRNGKKTDYVIRLMPSPRQIKDITITASKKKYSRKNNPSVEFMKKVIAHKRMNDIKNKPYYKYSKYEKMVCSVNNVTEKLFEKELKRFEFLKDQVEMCEETEKLILPLTLTETFSDVYYRKSPRSEKTVVKAEKEEGMLTLFQTGDMCITAVEDVFTDVDIYQNSCRLFQFPFTSPIADNAISFYRYYIQDTTYIEGDRVIQVAFVANNQQDLSFSGHLFVMDDSTYQVRRAELHIPGRSDINFVQSMNIEQEYVTLPSGERVMTVNDMLVELKLLDLIPTGALVRRTTRMKDFCFETQDDKLFRSIRGPIVKEPDAKIRTDAEWAEIRGDVELSKTEKNMPGFMNRLKHTKGVQTAIFAIKLFAENFIETGDSLHPNKVDIGPVNTIASYNDYDGLRLRASALTTANLSPHLFAKGFIAYGVKSKRLYGKAELTYSFNKKQYLPEEFPMHNLKVTYQNDIVSPFDQFLKNDKDNMFLSLKSGRSDQFNHINMWAVDYQHEHENGLSFYYGLKNTRFTPVDAMFYQKLDGNSGPVNDPSLWVKHMTTTELKASVSFEPGAKYSNTKQHRIKINKEAPIFSLTHTFGIDGLFGGEYTYNITEAEIWKRFWLPQAWGKVDVDYKMGAQWNKVPYPMLILPPANQSFIIQKNTFEMINLLEFMNDRYATLFIDWNLNGKLFNRIPLFQRLKWREAVGVNFMVGHLTNKNNPATSNYSDSDLFYFPGHFKNGVFESSTYEMKAWKPYTEIKFSIGNILKLFTVEYVRRLSYLDNPNARKHGVRIMFKLNF